jgi:Tol biopolymer transport system component
MREGVLMAQRLNEKLLQLEGESMPVASQVQAGGDTGRTGAFSVSDTGVLVYQTGEDSSANAHIVWVDREGKLTDTINQSGNNTNLRLSPDEKRVAVERRGPAGSDLWILELARGTNTRLTFADGIETDPVWSPDATQIVFRARHEGKSAIYKKLTNGLGDQEVFLKMDESISTVTDWSSDGKYLLFTADNDIWYLPLFGEKKPQRMMKTPFEEAQPRFSPDGRWLAYSSNESTPAQIYMQPFPPSPTGQRVQISVKGGSYPRWRGDGKELFYAAPDNAYVAVSLKFSGTSVEPGPEHRIWTAPPNSNANLSVTGDGNRFLLATRSGANAPKDIVESPITVVVNWPADLKTLPAK